MTFDCGGNRAEVFKYLPSGPPMSDEEEKGWLYLQTLR